MNSSDKHITINILPQDSIAWFFIAIAIVGASICWAPSAHFTTENDIKLAKINAEANKSK